MILEDTRDLRCRHLAVVEGKDDANFLNWVVKQSRQCDDVGIMIAQGKSGIRGTLRAAVALRGFGDVKTVTVVRDADQNPDGAKMSLHDSLVAASLKPPSKMLTLSDGNPQAGYIVVPTSTGCLETLLLDAYGNDALKSAAQKFVHDCDRADPVVGENEFAGSDLEKRRLLPLLAIGQRSPRMVRPGLSIGVSLSCGLWDAQHELFQPYVAYFASLP